MKNLSFLLGLGAGFVLGSRAGSGPYQHLEARVRSVTTRPEVQDAVVKVKGAAQDRVDQVATRAADRLPETEDAPVR